MCLLVEIRNICKKYMQSYNICENFYFIWCNFFFICYYNLLFAPFASVLRATNKIPNKKYFVQPNVANFSFVPVKKKTNHTKYNISASSSGSKLSIPHLRCRQNILSLSRLRYLKCFIFVYFHLLNVPFLSFKLC